MRINIGHIERATEILKLIGKALLRTKSVPAMRSCHVHSYGEGYQLDSISMPETRVKTSVNRIARFRTSLGHDNIIVQYGLAHQFAIGGEPYEAVFGGNIDRANKDTASFIATYLANGKVKLP